METCLHAHDIHFCKLQKHRTGSSPPEPPNPALCYCDYVNNVYYSDGLPQKQK